MPTFAGEEKFSSLDDIIRFLIHENLIQPYTTDKTLKTIQDGIITETPFTEEVNTENSYIMNQILLDEIHKYLLHQTVREVGGEGGMMVYTSPPRMLDIFINYRLNHRSNLFTKKEIEMLLQYSNIIRMASNPSERCIDGISFMSWHDVNYRVSDSLILLLQDSYRYFTPRNTSIPHITFKLSKSNLYQKNTTGTISGATPQLLEFLSIDNESFMRKYSRHDEFYLLRDICRSQLTPIS
jgi:hypothetical protein